MPPEAPLLQRLTESANELSANQRVLARHVRANYQSVAFSTVSQLAEQAGVSDATIVRFAKALGFSGYPAFQKEIRRMVRAELPGGERFKLGAKREDAAATPLDFVIEKERDNIEALRETHDPKAFARALQMIRRAPDVLVVGTRSTAPLARHLWFGLDKLEFPVTRALSIGPETFERVSRMAPRACLVLIGYPRYLRAHVELLEFAKARGVQTLTLTDSAFSPLQGDVSLYAPAESASFIGFHCAPLILLNALVHELSVSDGARTLAALDRFEALAGERQYFFRH